MLRLKLVADFVAGLGRAPECMAFSRVAFYEVDARGASSPASEVEPGKTQGTST